MLRCFFALVFLVKDSDQLETRNASILTDSTECPEIWEQHGSYKYCFSKSSTKFSSAKESCRKIDPLAELAVGNPSDELEFLERRALEKYWENIYVGCYKYSDYVSPVNKVMEIECLRNCRMKNDPYAGLQNTLRPYGKETYQIRRAVPSNKELCYKNYMYPYQGWNCVCETKQNMEAYGLSEHEEVDCHYNCNAFKSCGGRHAIALLDAIGPVFWLNEPCKEDSAYEGQTSRTGRSEGRANCGSSGCYGIKLTADFQYSLQQISCDIANNFICRKIATGLPIRQLNSDNGISWRDTTQPTIVFNQFPFAFVYDENAVVYYVVGYYYESLQYKRLHDRQSTEWIKYMGLNLNEVKSLRYDWRGKNIYWATENLIEVSDLQNQYSKSLYCEDLYLINSIVLDPIVGLMFWTDEGIASNITTHIKNNFPKIERAGMDGTKSSRLMITTEDLIRPVGLTLDSENSMLYWADTDNHLILSCDYEGYQRKTIKHLISNKIGKMVYFDQMLYFIDEKLSTLIGFNLTKDTVSVLAPLPYGEAVLLKKDLLTSYLSFNTHSEIDVYDWHLKLSGETTESGMSNEGCSHMALVSPVTRSLVCECDGNYIAQNDNICIEKEGAPTIILATFSHLLMCRNGSLENLKEADATDLTFDDFDGKVIYTSNDRTVYRMSITNASYTKEEETSFTMILIASDWMTGNIYFTCPCHGDEYSHHDIGVKSMRYERILINTKERIHSITIDPSSRLLFWSMKTSITRSSMDGDENTIVYITEFREGLYDIGTALAIDTSERMVYFNMVTKRTFEHTIKIENGRMGFYRMTYNGNNVNRIYYQRYNDYNLYSLTIDIYEDYLLLPITGNTTQLIKQCNKRNLTDCRELCLFEQKSDSIIDMIKTFHTLQATKLEKASSPCIKSNCTQLCLLSTTDPFYKCACHASHDLLPDNKTCATAPCKINNRRCSMHCKAVGVERTVECSCDRDYTLQNDNRTCAGDLGWALILTTVNGWIQLDIKTRAAIATWKAGKPNLLSFDPLTQRLFWSSLQDNVYAVYNSFVNGSGSKVIIDIVSEIITGLDVNWISRRLFWAADSKINVAHMNGSKISDMVIKYYHKNIPRIQGVVAVSGVFGLQSDSFNGYLYFITKYEVALTRTYDHYQIRCVRDVGAAVPCLLKFIWLIPSMIQPSFTVDFFRNKIFFITAQTAEVHPFYYKIMYMNSDGTTEHIFQGPVQHSQVRSLTILEANVAVARQFSINIIHDEVNDVESPIFTYPEHFPISGYMISANLLSRNGTDIKCARFAKCWSKKNNWICLKRDQICDGKTDCHMNTDEYYCDVCTSDCKMLKLEFKCLKMAHTVSEISEMEDFLDWKNHPFSRLISFIDVTSHDCSFKASFNEHPSRSRVMHFEVHSLYNLHRLRQVILSNSFRFTETLDHLTLSGPPFLLSSQSGDLSKLVNLTTMRLIMLEITYLPSRLFLGLVSLARLDFSDNVLLRQLDNNCFDGLDTLQQLTITGSNLEFISKYPFSPLNNLTFLNLSDNNIYLLEAGIFYNLEQLRIVDLRFNDIKLTSELFLHTTSLEYIYSSVFSLCCIKPETVKPEHCIAPTDDISNCKNLIKNRILAYFLWLFAILACTGNLAVLVYRGFVERSIFKKPYFMFVYNLGIADFLMSIYMIVIAVQDIHFDGNYVWNEYVWRASTLCKVSGMVSMISSEASIMFVCLITIERYLCAKFAFEEVRLTMKKAFTLSAFVWVFSLCLAIVPSGLFDKFYSRSGVCISIPLTKMQNSGEDFKLKIVDTEFGLEYSTTIYLGINFLLSIFIPAGQYGIYKEVKKSQERVRSTQKGRQIRLAKRLSVVVITDCLCWLPTGILIIMAMTGLTTPQDVYAWVIVFVLPVNSAINPYLYTLAHIDKEKVRKFLSRK